MRPTLLSSARTLAMTIACSWVALPTWAGILAPGDYDGSFPYQGHDRSNEFRVPTGYDGTVGLPLVLDLHGFGSFGGQQKLVSGYASLADVEGFVDEAETTFVQGAASCDTHDGCDGGVAVTLCSVVGRDFTGTLLEGLSGHLLYSNEDGVDLARESWTFLSGFQQSPPPVLVPEPGRDAGAAAACVGLAALARPRRRRGAA